MFDFHNPEMLWLIVPVLVAGAYLLTKATKKGLIISRTIVVILLIIALASPYTIVPNVVIDENPNIVLISDETDSMRLFDDQTASNLYESLTANTPTTLVRLTGDSTALGDAIMQYSTGDNQIVLVTDGNSNTGADLDEALRFAQDLGTTVHYVRPQLKHNDMSVQIKGDKTVLLNAPTRFDVVVSQAERKESTVDIRVEILDSDGQIVPNGIKLFKPTFESRTVSRQFTHVFNDVGAYTIVARIDPSGEDYDDINNVFYKTVYVIPQPKVHLVTTEPGSLFANNLRNLYRLSTSDSISGIRDIDEQKAVILDNIHSLSISEDEVSVLREFVSNGGGLYVVGGDTSFNKGDYLNSSIETLLPVVSRPSETLGEKYVVLVVDVSLSTSRGGEEYVTVGRIQDTAPTWPAIVESAKNIIGSEEFKDVTLGLTIPIVNYDGNVPENMLPLAVPQNVDVFQGWLDDIPNPGSGTANLDLGLKEAKDMLDRSTDDPGASKSIIILKDSEDIDNRDFSGAIETGKELVDEGYNIIYIQIESRTEGQISPDGNYKAEEFMTNIGAHDKYIGPVRGVEGINLADLISTDDDIPEREEFEDTYFEVIEFNLNHPITRNMDVSGNITGYNDVTPKPGSERILVTNTGKSVLTTWRFGLGRVAALSTDSGSTGWSSDLFAKNKNLTSSTVNWVVGNPREETGAVVEAPDTWYGTPSRVVLTMYDPGIPILKLNGNNVDLSLIGNNVYEAMVSPGNIGVHYLSGYPIAVNYALEYRDVGLNEDMPRLIGRYGGKTYTESEARALLFDDAQGSSERLVRETVSQKIYFLLAALVLFLSEVIVRRVREINEMKKQEKEIRG